MSWLSIVKLTKPQDTIWFEEAFPDKGYENNQFIMSQGIVITVEPEDQNNNIVTFTYTSEQAYNDFQVLYLNNSIKIEKNQYDNNNNIIVTRIYLGPSEDYNPI